MQLALAGPYNPLWRDQQGNTALHLVSTARQYPSKFKFTSRALPFKCRSAKAEGQGNVAVTSRTDRPMTIDNGLFCLGTVSGYSHWNIRVCPSVWLRIGGAGWSRAGHPSFAGG